MTSKKIKITQVRSSIRRTDKQKATLAGLGLHKIGQSREHELNAQIAGMIDKVNFLVKVEDVK
jgi:large subunit ribosomal protein L30